MFRPIPRFVLTALLIALWPGSAEAQDFIPVGTVSGKGMVTRPLVPTTLRMHTQLSVRGSTAEEALSRLKERRQGVAEKLEKLGADVETIAFGRSSVQKVNVSRATSPYPTSPRTITPNRYVPSTSTSNSSATQPMPVPSTTYSPPAASTPNSAPPTPGAPSVGTSLSPSPPSTSQSSGPPAPSTPPARNYDPYGPPTSSAYPDTSPPRLVEPQRATPPTRGGYSRAYTQPVKVTSLFTASVTVTVDWPLPGDGMDEVLIAAEALKEKIGAIDLTKIESPENASAEEDESDETTADPVRATGYYPPQPSPYGTYPVPSVSRSQTPGYRSMVFVAKISPEQRKSARAEAYAKAEAEARELAEAAGKELGSLASLSGSCGNSNLVSYPIAVHDACLMSPTAVFPTCAPPSVKENEVSSPDPRQIELRCWVSAAFCLR